LKQKSSATAAELFLNGELKSSRDLNRTAGIYSKRRTECKERRNPGKEAHLIADGTLPVRDR
jgi:hypothetical protein